MISFQALQDLYAGTYHRGQVTTLLRQMGARPPAIALLVYFDSRK